MYENKVNNFIIKHNFKENYIYINIILLWKII